MREEPPAAGDAASAYAGAAGDAGPSNAGASPPHAPGHRALRIGLTGPIGCGKSTVASWLGELGARVVDADQVAHQVTAPGSPGLNAVVEAFGSELVRTDGSLDRAALGRIVFADPEALARLEAIIHPAVRPLILEAMAAAEQDGASAMVVEAIKLVESGLASLCDEVWLVVCDPADQRARLTARLEARGSDAAEADRRIAAQSDIAVRLTPAATRIIDTTGSLESARAAVQHAWSAAMSSA